MAQIEVPSDIEIAQNAKLKPIGEIAKKAGFEDDDFECYGRHIAKITREKCIELSSAKSGKGKLILVTAMSPTPAGEGKTTTAVGLADALTANGEKTMLFPILNVLIVNMVNGFIFGKNLPYQQVKSMDIIR